MAEPKNILSITHMIRCRQSDCSVQLLTGSINLGNCFDIGAINILLLIYYAMGLNTMIRVRLPQWYKSCSHANLAPCRTSIMTNPAVV